MRRINSCGNRTPPSRAPPPFSPHGPPARSDKIAERIVRGKGRGGGGHLGGTTARLLRLLDQYGPTALNAALVEAHERAAFSAHFVAHILDQRRRAEGQLPPVQTIVSDDSRVRDLVVTLHALGDYATLAAREGECDE
jgi:hypothetical protein